jgi:predicted RNA binding protein YcfA (HicA-like mRNA interferase family)
MAFPPNVWNQLKSITASELAGALERDGWSKDTRGGSAYIYLSADKTKRASVHFHPGKTYGAKTLQGLLEDIGWTVEDLRRLKLIRR